MFSTPRCEQEASFGITEAMNRPHVCHLVTCLPHGAQGCSELKREETRVRTGESQSHKAE